MNRHSFAATWRGLLLTLGLLCRFGGAARACSCMTDYQVPISRAEVERATKAGIYKEAIVFAGKVTSIRQVQTSDRGNGKEVSFLVSRRWLGSVHTLTTVATGMTDDQCGYNFTVGSAYLVYANITYGDLATTNNCTPTKLLHDADADLAILGPGQLPIETFRGLLIVLCLTTIGGALYLEKRKIKRLRRS